MVEPGQRSDLVARRLSDERAATGRPRYTKMFGACSYLRDEVSYLVEVPHPGKGKPLLYWPRVDGLREPED